MVADVRFPAVHPGRWCSPSRRSATRQSVERPVAAALVSRDRAQRIALGVAGGGDVRLVHLDDGDVAEWRLVIGDDAGCWLEVTIDARNGRVTDIDVQDD